MYDKFESLQFLQIETSHPSWKYRDGLGERRLPPYSRLSVSVRALTYWGTARRVTSHLYSPPSIPTPPVATRFYISPSPIQQLHFDPSNVSSF